MILLPKPKEMTIEEGFYKISYKDSIVLDTSCGFHDFEAAKLLQEEIKECIGLHIGINKAFNNGKAKGIYLCLNLEDKGREAFQLLITQDRIEIMGGEASGLFYGIQTLRQVIRLHGSQLPCVSIKDSPHFANRGYFYDITRGKMPTLDSLKEMVDRLSFYKINQFQLYIEYTFAFKKHSEVWIKSDPITSEEILELDEYCIKRHIELVPCLATFSHLYDVLDSNSFNELSEMNRNEGRPFTWYNRMRYHTLDVSNPKSLDFIKSMLDEYIPLFSSDKFNICCDETFDLGLGKSKCKADEIGIGQLYVDFLNQVVDYVKSYNKQIMFWGDIILNHPDCIPKMTKDVTLLNWYYYDKLEEKNISLFTEHGFKQYVCPSVSGFSRLVNQLDMSFLNISDMIKYGKKHNAAGVLNTDWGDSGHVNFLASGIAGMIFGAALSWNPDDDSNYDTMDENISILEFGERSGRLVGLLRKLCRQDKIIWNTIAFWRDEKIYNIFINQGCKSEFDKYDEKTLVDAVKNANDITEEILQVSREVPARCKLDMEELYLSARGVALIQALSLIIKKYDYKEDIKTLVYTAWELAEMLEYWFYDFARVWRERSKEAELFRIKEAIIQICDILRNYDRH